MENFKPSPPSTPTDVLLGRGRKNWLKAIQLDLTAELSRRCSSLNAICFKEENPELTICGFYHTYRYHHST